MRKEIHDVGLSSQVRVLTEALVATLGELFCQAAMESVRGALGDEPVGQMPDAVRYDRGARSLASKRSPAELEEISQRLLEYVRTHPGRRMEQIADGMQIDSRLLSLPIRRLVVRKALIKRGWKRATEYHAQ